MSNIFDFNMNMSKYTVKYYKWLRCNVSKLMVVFLWSHINVWLFKNLHNSIIWITLSVSHNENQINPFFSIKIHWVVKILNSYIKRSKVKYVTLNCFRCKFTIFQKSCVIFKQNFSLQLSFRKITNSLYAKSSI